MEGIYKNNQAAQKEQRKQERKAFLRAFAKIFGRAVLLCAGIYLALIFLAIAFFTD